MQWPEAEFEAVFLEHYGRIVSVLLRLLGDRTRAEELANDNALNFSPSVPLRCPVPPWSFMPAPTPPWHCFSPTAALAGGTCNSAFASRRSLYLPVVQGFASNVANYETFCWRVESK